MKSKKNLTEAREFSGWEGESYDSWRITILAWRSRQSFTFSM